MEDMQNHRYLISWLISYTFFVFHKVKNNIKISSNILKMTVMKGFNAIKLGGFFAILVVPCKSKVPSVMLCVLRLTCILEIV